MSLILALRLTDGHWLVAGDSLCAAGDTLVDAAPKVHRRSDGTVIGHAGSGYLGHAYLSGLPQDADLFDPRFQRDYCVTLYEREANWNERLPEKMRAEPPGNAHVIARGERCITVAEDGMTWPEHQWTSVGPARELVEYLLSKGWHPALELPAAIELATTAITAVSEVRTDVRLPVVWEMS